VDQQKTMSDVDAQCAVDNTMCLVFQHCAKDMLLLKQAKKLTLCAVGP
jgi:hypothetical protein